MSSIGPVEVPRIADPHDQNTTRANFIDLTLDDDSDSDLNSLFGDMPESESDVDEKVPISNTSGSNHGGGQTTHPQSPKSTHKEDEESDDNDLSASLSLVRKRKQKQLLNGIGSPKRPKAHNSSSSISLEDCQAFFGGQLKDASNFFAIYQPPIDQSEASARQALTASRDRAKVNKDQKNGPEEKTDGTDKACEEEQVVSHPFLLNYVRCDDFNKQKGYHKQHRSSNSSKRTSRSQQPGQNPVSQLPIYKAKNDRTVEDSRPDQRSKATTTPDVFVSKRSTNVAEHFGHQKKKLPTIPPPPHTNKSPGDGDESSSARPCRTDTDRYEREDSLFGPQTPSMQGGSARTFGSASRRNDAGRNSVSGRSQGFGLAFDDDDGTSLGSGHNRRGPSTRSSQPAHKIGQRKPWSSEPVTRDGHLQPSEVSQPYHLQGSFGADRRPEEPPAYARTAKNKWDRIAQLGKPSNINEAKRGMRRAIFESHIHQQSQPRKGIQQRRPREINHNRSDAETRLLRAQQALVSSAENHSYSQSARHESSDLTTPQRPLAATNDVQSRSETRTKTPELEVSGRQRLPQQDRASQVPQRFKTYGTAKGPRPQATRLTQEDIAEAEAQFKALKAKHEQKRTATLVDALPANFGMAQPGYLSRARAVRNIGIREKVEENSLDRQIRAYAQRIRRDVQKKHADESEEFRETVFQQKFNSYLEKKLKQRDFASVGLTVESLESGQGGRFNVEKVDLDARTLPASQALEPTQTIVIYPVYMSGPYASGSEYEKSLMRTKAFGTMKAANSYAKKLLENPVSPSSKRSEDKDSKVLSRHESFQHDMLLGLIKLESGNDIVVEVRKEQMLFGDLDPGVLRDKRVDKTVLDLYRPRYDLWYITRTPKAWKGAEKRDCQPQEQEQENQENRGGEQQQKARATEDLSAGNEQDPQGLEGSRLRAALDALSAPGSNPQLDLTDVNDTAEDFPSAVDRDENVEEGKADDETSSQASDDSTESFSSKRTVRGSSSTTVSPSGEEECHTLCLSYTTLQLANKDALRLAGMVWKPRSAHIDAQVQWENDVCGEIKWWKTEADLNNECVNMVLVPKFEGPVDRRPWGFVRAEIKVTETALEGPRDLGVNFVLDHNPYKSMIMGRAAGSAVPTGGQGDGAQQHINLEDSDSEGDGDGGIFVHNDNDGDDTETVSEEE